MIRESKCKFEERDDYTYIKLDEHPEYRKHSHRSLKCVDLVIINEGVYFLEIKCYEFFGDELDEKINEILQKLKDTLYFLIFYKLEDRELMKIREKLYPNNPYLVIIICPPCNPSNTSILPDRLIVLKETLAKRFKEFLDNILVDTEKNEQNLFSSIERE